MSVLTRVGWNARHISPMTRDLMTTLKLNTTWTIHGMDLHIYTLHVWQLFSSIFWVTNIFTRVRNSPNRYTHIAYIRTDAYTLRWCGPRLFCVTSLHFLTSKRILNVSRTRTLKIGNRAYQQRFFKYFALLTLLYFTLLYLTLPYFKYWKSRNSWTIKKARLCVK